MQKLNFNETFESPFTVFSNPVYEGGCDVTAAQVTRCTLLWCDTNGSCCLKKDLVEAVTVSDTACCITVLLI